MWGSVLDVHGVDLSRSQLHIQALDAHDEITGHVLQPMKVRPDHL